VNVAAILGAGKELGQRFTLVDLIPSALLGLYGLALVWGGAPSRAPAAGRFAQRLEDLSGVEAALLAFALLAFALICQPLQFGLVRFLEGYWGGSRPALALAEWGSKRHRRLRARLEGMTLSTAADPDDTIAPIHRSYAAWALARRYPPPPLVMPTRLGNALRAAEDRAGRRYGLDAITAWPRLYPLLSERVRVLIDDQRAQMDVAARFTVVLLAASLGGVALLIAHPVWLLLPAATLGLAWLSYRGACSAAIGYGDGLETAFDLHRLDLRTHLHLPLPATLEEERRLNAELTKFLLQPFAGRQLTYQHGEPD
jgi:hypothetical protein